MNLNDEQLFERECRYLAFVLQEQGLSLRDLQTDPVSTELVQACCEELHLSREEFDALVSRVIRVLKAADEKLRNTSLQFYVKGRRHRNLDEIERQPDPLGRTRAQFGKGPRD